MTERNPKVDAFILNAKKWQDEFAALRELVLGSELTEELKWGVPCYTIGQKNVRIGRFSFWAPRLSARLINNRPHLSGAESSIAPKIGLLDDA